MFTRFCETPTGKQETDRDEDWALFHKYHEQLAVLDDMYLHFRWNTQFRALTGVVEAGSFTQDDVLEWLTKASKLYGMGQWCELTNSAGRVLDLGRMTEAGFISQHTIPQLTMLWIQAVPFYIA
jgi:hypothetical protein